MEAAIRISGPVELTAAANSKPARISIMAYSGGVMSVSGYGPLVIDLAGVELPGRVPLLADHNANLDSILGSGKPSVSSGRLHVAGELADGERSQRLVALSKAGVPLQASVGVDPLQRQRLRPGEKMTVNGRTITAGEHGLLVVTKGRLREVSVLAIGADSKTTVAIAASKGLFMDEHDNANNANLNNNTSTETITAERQRVSEIIATCDGKHADIQAQAIAEGWTIQQTKATLLERIRAERPRAPAVQVAQSGPADQQTIEATLMVRAGREALAVTAYGEQIAEHARRLRAYSLVDVVAACLRLDGRDPSGMSRSEMIRAGFSSLALPAAFENVMGKSLLPAYQESTGTWRGFARVMPAADFKPQGAIRPSFVGQLEKLPAHGEIKHGTLNESKIPWSVDTFAKMFRVSRQDFLNDDLGFIDETPGLMAKAGARSVNDLVFSTLMAGVGSHFAAGNNNIVESDNELTLDSLGAAVALMRSQRDADNNDIQITPRVLLVPPELESTARQILNSEMVGRTDGEPSGNPLRNVVELADESRLSNDGKFANASETGWYLLAGPMDVPFVVGFLDGRQSPTVEFFGLDSDPNTLGLTFRVYHDFGAALGDPRAAVYSDGDTE